MNYIETVQELTEILDEADPLDHAKVMRRIKIDAHEIRPFITWSKQEYTRNCIARTEKYELILLCWDKGAKTPIHGHGGEDCWVYQVYGTVEEIRFVEEGNQLKPIHRMELSPGKLTYMNDDMGYHSIQNESNQRAMTLHIYASPIDLCEVYNEDEDCFEIKEMAYHTYKGDEVESTTY